MGPRVSSLPVPFCRPVEQVGRPSGHVCHSGHTRHSHCTLPRLVAVTLSTATESGAQPSCSGSSSLGAPSTGVRGALTSIRSASVRRCLGDLGLELRSSAPQRQALPEREGDHVRPAHLDLGGLSAITSGSADRTA